MLANKAHFSNKRFKQKQTNDNRKCQGITEWAVLATLIFRYFTYPEKWKVKTISQNECY